LTDFENADLSNSDIHGTYLVSASLIGTDLTDANLTGAYLIDTDLTGANLTNASLHAVLYDENTVFPSGDIWDAPPWGLDGGIPPWDAGMIPVPEPTSGLMLAVGSLALAVMGRRDYPASSRSRT